ncbi:MAG: hypothetical protein HY925_15755 [Elusimicrobia bacterium]|nr:hypothetical protein [Elusimicrobiota bacterium]
MGSRIKAAALAALWLAPSAHALSPIYPRPAPSPLIGPSAAAIAGAVPAALTPADLSLPASIGSAAQTGLPSKTVRPLVSLALLRRVGGLIGNGRDLAGMLSSFWTGAQPLAAPVSVPPSAPEFLHATRPADREFLARAVEAARASPTAASILDRVEALAERRGRPVQVRIRDLGNNWGEYDYIEDRLDIHSRFREEPALAAPTLAHELLHILQHEEDVPADALELELEAHILTLRIME